MYVESAFPWCEVRFTAAGGQVVLSGSCFRFVFDRFYMVMVMVTVQGTGPDSLFLSGRERSASHRFRILCR